MFDYKSMNPKNRLHWRKPQNQGNEVWKMDKQLNLFSNNVESVLNSMIPQRFSASILSTSLVPLKGKYTDSIWKSTACSNFCIELKKSMYYMNGGSATLCKVSEDAAYFPELGKNGIFRLMIESDLARLQDIMPKRLERLFPTDKFGCCSLFKECSNQGHCIHSNAFYSASCVYKANLEAGRNFYK